MEPSNWFGCLITIDCGESLGIFQGQISAVDSKHQTISLVKAFRNGLQCQVPEITISARDIQSLEILKTSSELETPDVSKISLGSDSTDHVDSGQHTCRSPLKNGDVRPRTSSVSEMRRKTVTPRKSEPRRRWQEKDDDCLNTPLCSDVFETEFDFEKNLALFDKQAVFEAIDAAAKPDVVRLVDINQQTPKYRCEENVLEQQPIVHRQIRVPFSVSKEYVTDSGLIVPSIPLNLREQLFTTATSLGFTVERQNELFGRAGSDMILQLLGGSHRLNPRNSHQIPSVVLLCGPCSQGMQAISCGRHLASHEVNVTAYVPEVTTCFSPQMLKELTLYQLSNGKLASSVSALPTGTTDVIVCALDGHEKLEEKSKTNWYMEAIQWVSHCKAPILTIDPPVSGVRVNTKWSLVPVLPLDLHTALAGNVYLCDLAIPKKIFAKVDISYKSPFGPKCVIPLHLCPALCTLQR